MRSNIISLSGVQCAGKTVVADQLGRLMPEVVIYDGKIELKRYLENPDKKGIVIIVEYASALLFPFGYLDPTNIDRFAKCGLVDKQHFEKGKHFLLDLQSEKIQHERLLEREGGFDGYAQTIMKEYPYRSQYLRMLGDKGYFTKVIVVDDKSIEEITREIMDEIV